MDTSASCATSRIVAMIILSDRCLRYHRTLLLLYENILTNIKSINQKFDTINISLEEQTKSEKSILDALDRIKEVEDCIEVCPYCGQSLKGGNHVFRTSN